MKRAMSKSEFRVSGPLSGLVVLDLTRVLAGPYCTMLLGDLGARIIKVEPPEGDDSRRYGPFINGKSGYFTAFNRGKESIALDLKADADRAIFERLLAKADVLVENYRPGTMEKLGYGWETLHERHPRLIYAAASGFGHSGPYANRPAYDMVVQAMGGIMSITGHPGGPPTRVGSSIGDITAGLFTTIGIVVRPLRPRAQRRRHEGRCRDAGLPGGDPGERDHALFRNGPFARTAWRASRLHRALCRLCRRRRASGGCRRNRCVVRQTLRGARPAPVWPAIRAMRPTRFARDHVEALTGEIEALLKASSGRPLA